MAPHRPEPPLSGAEIRTLIESYQALAASGFQPDAFAEPIRHDFHTIDDDLIDYFITHRPIPGRAETPPDPALQSLTGARVRLVHCPFERPGWWDVAVYASAAGLRFESGVVAAIEDGCRHLLEAEAAAAS